MCLMIFQKGKKLFQTIKHRKLKKSKIGIFPKGLVHGFGQKFENFPFFIFGKIREENVFDDILERKKAFLDYKKWKLKTVKNWDFPKGVSPWFWSKIRNFSIFLLLAKSASKTCLTIFYKGTKLFQTIKNRKLKKSKIGIFPKGLVHGFGEKFELFPSFYYWQNQLAKRV